LRAFAAERGIVLLNRKPMSKPTGIVARGIDPSGAAYQRRALSALPILVRQASAEQTIFYSDLADELGMQNERNLNYVLGSVATSLMMLSERWGKNIPPLQAIVVNQRDRLPGVGFAQGIAKPEMLLGASKRTRRQIVNAMLADVYAYKDWRAVLGHFGVVQDLRKEIAVSVVQASLVHGGPESDAHKDLKYHIAENPHAIGLHKSILSTSVEHKLPSGDQLDILFLTRGAYVGVEVKSHISSEADLTRGIFQCVKYEAVLNAVAQSEGARIDVSTILAIGGKLPKHLRALANTLGVTVVEAANPDFGTRAV
jgi:hypothetical protein